MKTYEKIRKLERDVAALWSILEDERLWHPSVIREIQRRSETARRARFRGRLKTADEVFSRS